ncbi:MAG: HlyD family secretion protein [Gammaproteobacteria bacterium]|nr:HlyD family secretion protein [Gammaproteobacteria bacterium]
MRRFAGILFIFLIILFMNGCNWNSQNQLHGYIEGKFTYVASQTEGTLDKLFVQRGDQANQGAPLFKLDPYPQITQAHEAQAKFNQAQSNLADLQKGRRPTEIAAIEAQKRQVEAQLAFAQKTLTRYQKLYQKGFIEKSRLDEANSNYQNFKAQLFEINENLKTAKLAAREDEVQAAAANVKAAKAALDNMLWQLKQKTIYAPASGTVFDTFYREGELVPVGYPVVELLAPENIYAIFFVPEKQLSSLHLGQTVKITCDGCSGSFDAKISFISPQAEFTPPVIYSEKTRSKLIYRIEARFSTQDAVKFHPGQPISIKLSL